MGENYFGTDRVVDDLVRRLRKKMPELEKVIEDKLIELIDRLVDEKYQ